METIQEERAEPRVPLRVALVMELCLIGFHRFQWNPTIMLRITGSNIILEFLEAFLHD